MSLSRTEIEARRREIKYAWTSYPVNRNRFATDALETGIIYGSPNAKKLRNDIERYQSQSPTLNIGYTDLIKSAVAFGNRVAVVELWNHLEEQQREKMSFNGEIWGLALKYKQDDIAAYLLENHHMLGFDHAQSLKNMAPWASLNTLRLAAAKFDHTPLMCASALLEACANPRDDVMLFLAQLSGSEAIKKMQYGIANPHMAQALGDSHTIEKVDVFNAFVQKKMLYGKMGAITPTALESVRKM